MAIRPGIQRIPWDRIAVLLATAVVVAWSTGFLVGLVVRVVSSLRG
jgi:hypothetical protein